MKTLTISIINALLAFAIAKTMAQEEFCQGCNQRHRCQEVYQRLGSAEGASIAPKAVVAFLLPMLVFIACLAASQEILAKAIAGEELQTVLGVLLALAVTLVAVLIAKAVNRQIGKNG